MMTGTSILIVSSVCGTSRNDRWLIFGEGFC